MLFSIFPLLLILPFLSFSQSTETEILEQRKEEIQSQIKTLQDSLYKINREIERIKPKEPTEIEPARTVARNGGTIKKSPLTQGEVVMELTGYTSLRVLDWENYHYKVSVRDTVGYIEEKHLAKDIYVLKHRESFFKKQKEKEAIEKEKELALQKEKWEEEKKQQNKVVAKKRQQEEKRMIEKYGKEKVDTMKEGRVWIGMNKEQAIYSRGRPKDVNRTVGSWGTKEQWVYNGIYLYFENGGLTSWQD